MIFRSRSVSGLDDRLVDVFCRTFGAKHRKRLTVETSMDDIDGWDSLSFLDLVQAIEDEYQVTFTPDEAAQMFQLGHIQRLLTAVRLDIPHDDVAQACCLVHELKRTPDVESFVVLSGSSSREGLLRPEEAEALLREHRPGARWLNVSVSGLVFAESLQLLEVVGTAFRGVLALGVSPVLVGTCGRAEFRRAASHRRFPFAAPTMERILADHGYRPEDHRPLVTIETWAERYLKGRGLDSIAYEPYLYPTLQPWGTTKFESRADLLRFYNDSVLDHDESFRINPSLLDALLRRCRELPVPVVLVEQTMHGRALAQLGQIGDIPRRYGEVLESLVAEHGVAYVDPPAMVGITDDDFRDPAHVFRRQGELTRATIEGVLRAAS